MKIFQERIKQLQLNNALVVFKENGSAYGERLLQELVRGYQLVDLSLPAIRLQVEQNPLCFAQNLPEKAYLANLHYTPSVLGALLTLVGSGAKQIVGSCSQDYYLKEELASACEDEGDFPKVVFLELPLTEPTDEPAFLPVAEQMEEFAAKAQRNDVVQGILQGSGAWGENISAYLRRVLQQDIMEQTTCSDDIKFYRFLCTAASMAGTVLNYTTLANAVGITAPTAKQWLRFLEGTGMVYLLQALENVPGKRLMKAPKLYFRDTGIAASLLQIADAASLIQSIYFKKLYENYVVNKLRESYLQRGEEPQWCFYRDSNAKEISIVLQHGGSVHPMLIDKDGISKNKLRKSFAILDGYAEGQGLELASGCLLSSAGPSRELAAGLWQIDVAVL